MSSFLHLVYVYVQLRRDCCFVCKASVFVFRFFTGPYKGGSTRRVYRHGKKDIRFILDGEEKEPLRWSPGDRMSLLIRAKDWDAEQIQWTVALYINR